MARGVPRRERAAVARRGDNMLSGAEGSSTQATQDLAQSCVPCVPAQSYLKSRLCARRTMGAQGTCCFFYGYKAGNIYQAFLLNNGS